MDTQVVLYCNYAADNDYDYVKVRSPDSDIFFILLYYAANLGIRIMFDTGNKRTLLDINKLAKDNGWVMVNGRIKPKWYEGESLPPQLVDILQDYNNEDEIDSGSDADQFSDEDGRDSDSDND